MIITIIHCSKPYQKNDPAIMNQLICLIFSLDDHLFALPAADVEHIIRAVAITPLPDAPELVTGILNMRGEFIPVINIRLQFHLPPKAIQVSDRLILADAYGYRVAFIADTVEDVVQLSPKPLNASEGLLSSDMKAGNLFPGMEKFIKGVSEFSNRTVLIYDIHSLFPEETIRLATDAITYSPIEEPA
jgi:purine-binding chemotaxis protein CheW